MSVSTEGSVDGLDVAPPRLAVPDVGIAAHFDDGAHREGELEDRLLGQDSAFERELLRRVFAQGLVVEAHLAGRRLKLARQQAQQGGLAGAVRPDDAEDFAAAPLQADAVDEDSRPDLVAHADGFEHTVPDDPDPVFPVPVRSSCAQHQPQPPCANRVRRINQRK